MNPNELEALARDIEELKRVVRRNTPAIQEVFDIKGWDVFALAAGLLVSAFALGAHVLSAVYGSFDAIPAAWQAALYALLAVAFVGSGVVKYVLVARRTSTGGLWRVLGSFFGARGKHIYISFLGAIAAVVTAAFSLGHPWLAMPAAGILLGLMSNSLAGQYDQPSLLALGYWAIATGCAGLWFYASAPFLWVFIIYGGMLIVFAGAVRLHPRRRAGRSAAADSGQP